MLPCSEKNSTALSRKKLQNNLGQVPGNMSENIWAGEF